MCINAHTYIARQLSNCLLKVYLLYMDGKVTLLKDYLESNCSPETQLLFPTALTQMTPMLIFTFIMTFEVENVSLQ